MKLDNIKDLEVKLNAIKAVDIMSRFAITTKEGATISNLAHLLMRFKISGVPVVNENKEIIGIITATDLFRILEKVKECIKADSPNEFSGTIFVKDIMTKDVSTILENASLFDVIDLMCQKNIHTLPVLNAGKDIVGIIGRRDVINAFYSEAT